MNKKKGILIIPIAKRSLAVRNVYALSVIDQRFGIYNAPDRRKLTGGAFRKNIFVNETKLKLSKTKRGHNRIIRRFTKFALAAGG